MTDLGHDLDLELDLEDRPRPAPVAASAAPARRRQLFSRTLPRMAALAASEFVLLMLAFIAAVHMRFGDEAHLATDALLMRAPLFTAVILGCLASMGLFSLRHRASYAAVVARIAVGMGLALSAIGLLSYLVPAVFVGRGVLLLGGVLGTILLLASRFAAMKLLEDDSLKRRVVILGSGETAAVIAARFRRRADQRAFKIVGYLPWKRENPVVSHDQILASPADLTSFVLRERVDQVVVALDDRRGGFPQDTLRELRLCGVTITDPVTFLEQESGYVSVDLARPSWLIFSEGFPSDLFRAATKRAFDVMIAAVLLVLTLPVAIVTAILIKLEDGGPILYQQVRAGQNGRPFRMLKFRSMGVAAEKDGKAVWAMKNDPRVTRIGAFIRKVRIDELPQCLNVLLGHMSFVGPRPERPQFVDELSRTIPFYRERHFVKPGLTGWAQVRYPYGSTEKDAREKLGFDLYYVKNHSLILDFVILLVTAEIILFRVGSR
jgi:sugar transferase (PEP-CTERM system associated)